jgi:arylsulfatase A-like enzyme
MASARRRIFLGSAAALAVGGATLVAHRQLANRPPRTQMAPAAGRRLNVLFILSDQERSWAQLPAGFIERHCPNRAWLLEHGVSIAGANTTTQFCSMARGSVYSGLHAPRNGLWDNTPLPYADGLRHDVATLGTLFQDAGYTTGYTGKWHLTHMADEGVADAAAVQRLVRRFGFDDVGIGGETDGALVGQQRDGTTAERAVAFMQRQRGGGKPWMLAVNLLNPHDIMYYTAGDAMTRSRVSQFPDRSTRPPTDGVYAQDLGYPVFGSWGPATRQGKPAAVIEFTRTMDEALGHMPYDDPAVAREFQNYYLNCLRDSDRHLGTVLAGLRASGELGRTVIVFTSDHGEFLGAHGMRGKGSSIYREASEVPMVLVHPEGRKAATSRALMSHVDVLPTLLGLAGLDVAAVRGQLPALPGMDCSALVADPQRTGPRDSSGLLAYWTGLTFLNHAAVRRFDEIRRRPAPTRIKGMVELLRENVTKSRGAMRGLITPQYKFARYFKPVEHHTPGDWATLVAMNDIELYDTAADPRETRNLAHQPAERARVLALNAQLNELVGREIGADDGRFLPLLVRL